MSLTIQQAMERMLSCMEAAADMYATAAQMKLNEAAEGSKFDMNVCALAFDALKEKAEREDPRPLTAEELRGMIGEPVWTVGVYLDGDTWAGWDIVDGFDDDGVTFGYSTEKPEWWAYDLRDQDGRLFGCAWVAYRYKPKEVRP